MRRIVVLLVAIIIQIKAVQCQNTRTVIYAQKIFDGIEFRDDGVVAVRDGIIEYAGPTENFSLTEKDEVLDLSDVLLMPGMIEGHAHLLLHPYDEVSWNDQVLKESLAERSIRAATHAEATLLAGFTTVRDLGSEGAGFADVGVKQAIDKGIIRGPRMLVAGPAIVATGSYGPKGFAEHVHVPLGAIEADGHDALIREVRRQIGGGVDVIKIYADYRWGAAGQAMPTYSEEEIALVVRTARSSGREVVAHATTQEGMRRAARAGVSTIEHGDEGTREIFELMKELGVAYCPTLAAAEAIEQYRGWSKGSGTEPKRIVTKKSSFSAALESGVTIVAGGDSGVFPHGENVRELELMEAYGMPALEVLKTVTSGNAGVLGLGHITGKIEKGLAADLIAVRGNPLTDMSSLRNITMVMKEGVLVFLNE